MRCRSSTLIALTTAGLLSLYAACLAEAGQASWNSGKQIYDFYCYQCHGYAGDAATLASTYLSPPPRNFSISTPEQLDRARMIDAVSRGREGTAMVSFSSVLSTNDIEAVVEYIRQRLMRGVAPDYIYHTEANGWPDHQHHAAAFPFARGELSLDTPVQQLTEDQQAGRRLFMQSCISCHDRAVAGDAGPVWELHPLSYPRRHYDHTKPLDDISGASPYALHEREPETAGLGEQQQRGAQLFQQNCAFCHGADATGGNWIGRFLEPHARDLTRAAITHMPDATLERVIRNGLEGTSMPAWKHVLDDGQISDLVSYLKRETDNARSEALPAQASGDGDEDTLMRAKTPAAGE